MTLYKALKILLKLDERETIVLGFKSWCSTTKFDTANYLAKQADKWYNHSISVFDTDEVMRSVDKANAYNFMRGFLESKNNQIWIKQSTCDYHNAYSRTVEYRANQ